jgi:hypothetical protein
MTTWKRWAAAVLFAAGTMLPAWAAGPGQLLVNGQAAARGAVALERAELRLEAAEEVAAIRMEVLRKGKAVCQASYARLGAFNANAGGMARQMARSGDTLRIVVSFRSGEQQAFELRTR